MTKPTPQAVTDYAKSIDFELDGEAFCDFYLSKGWLVGKAPMKDWQAAVRTWKRSSYKRTKKRLFQIIGKYCGVKDCNMPAYHKGVGGAYDHYYCLEHLPKIIKTKYLEQGYDV